MFCKISKMKAKIWFRVLRNCENFAQIFTSCLRNFTKFEKNFTKHEIKNFAKISRNYKNENFRSHPSYSTFTTRHYSVKWNYLQVSNHIFIYNTNSTQVDLVNTLLLKKSRHMKPNVHDASIDVKNKLCFAPWRVKNMTRAQHWE